MSALTTTQFIRDALSRALSEDDRVFIMGEDIAAYGGSFGGSSYGGSSAHGTSTAYGSGEDLAELFGMLFRSGGGSGDRAGA